MKIHHLTKRTTVPASLLATLLLLTACTILDNDLREEASTDPSKAFEEVVHVEEPLFEADYQYMPDVIVFDPTMEGYVIGINEECTELRMYDYTTDERLPKVGQLLAASPFDQVPRGLAHRVRSVTKRDGEYVLTISKASVEEIFKTLSLDANLLIRQDGTAESQEAKGGRWRVLRKTDDRVEKDLTFSGELEFKKGGEVTSGNGTGGLTFEGSVEGKVTTRVGPVVELNVHYDKPADAKEAEYDINATMNFVMELGAELTGSIGFEYDLIKSLGLKIPPIPIGIPGVSIFITLTPEIGFGAGMAGSVNLSYVKNMGFGAGFRKNMTEADGPYLIKCEPEPFSWKKNGECSANLEFNAHVTLGLNVDVGVETPNAGGYVGVKFQPGIGSKYSIAKGQTFDPYDQMLEFSVPITPTGGFYVDTFGLLGTSRPERWDLIDHLKEKLGFTFLPWTPEAWKSSWRFYPSIDGLTIMCANSGTAVQEAPQFFISFNSNDYGVITRTGRPVFPSLTIVDPDTGEEILKHDFSQLEKGKTNSYLWDFTSPKIKRDKLYRADLSVGYHNIYKDFEKYYTKKIFFTAVSPTALVEDHKVLKNELEGKIGRTKSVQYTFVTYMRLIGEKEIVSKWGIEVPRYKRDSSGELVEIPNSRKSYEIPEAYWKPGKYKIKWTAKHDTKQVYEYEAKQFNNSNRVLYIEPYIIDNQGTHMNPTSYRIDLQWVEGLNLEDTSDSGYQNVDMSGKKLVPRRGAGSAAADDDGFELIPISIERCDD